MKKKPQKKKKNEVIGTDIEMEYEDMDTEDEEHEVRTLTKEELEMYHQYKEFYTIQARTKGEMPSFGYIHRLKVKEHYPGVPTDLVEVLGHPIEGEVQDIDCMTEQEITQIEQKHAVVPRRRVNIRPKKKTVILCIDPDSDSDIIIEEEGDFRERCIITKGNEQNVEEEAEQADDEQSEPLTTAETEPGMSLTAEQETEDKDETISSTSTQGFDREKVEREFINLASHYQQIGESFKKLVEEVPHMKKRQLATNLAKMPILPMIKIEEKVSSMYRQHYKEEPSQVQEECDLKVYGENVEKKLQSIINSIGDQSALFLMAVGDFIVNKKSQAEIATKYNISRSRKQWAMSGKKEHRKGGKQY